MSQNSGSAGCMFQGKKRQNDSRKGHSTYAIQERLT